MDIHGISMDIPSIFHLYAGHLHLHGIYHVCTMYIPCIYHVYTMYIYRKYGCRMNVNLHFALTTKLLVTQIFHLGSATSGVVTMGWLSLNDSLASLSSRIQAPPGRDMPVIHWKVRAANLNFRVNCQCLTQYSR